jgi:hypothetical protein
MTLQHLRLVAVTRELLSPSNVIFGSLPLSVVDESVSNGDLVEENVPGCLGHDVADFPVSRFL